MSEKKNQNRTLVKETHRFRIDDTADRSLLQECRSLAVRLGYFKASFFFIMIFFFIFLADRVFIWADVRLLSQTFNKR